MDGEFTENHIFMHIQCCSLQIPKSLSSFFAVSLEMKIIFSYFSNDVYVYGIGITSAIVKMINFMLLGYISIT